MEFFNKQQDVLDLKLTGYGKQLLAQGLFRPVYYAFSDDGVMYDAKWMSGTLIQEQQSQTEPRIQENTPRLKTQNRKIGAERGIYGTDPISTLYNLADLFEVPNWQLDMPGLQNTQMMGLLYGPDSVLAEIHPPYAEAEKLLESVLGTKSYFNDYNPAWSVLFYNGIISGSTSYYQKNDITLLVPQLNCTLKDTVYKISPKVKPYKDIDRVLNIQLNLQMNDTEFEEAVLDTGHAGDLSDIGETYFQEFPLENGTVFIVKDFLFLSVEEANTEFTNDNFTVEVFEVTTTVEENDGEEEITKMVFGQKAMPLIIEMDDEINARLACSLIRQDKTLKDQNIYNASVFDCSDTPSGPTVNNDPYEDLPVVDVGDVC